MQWNVEVERFPFETDAEWMRHKQQAVRLLLVGVAGQLPDELNNHTVRVQSSEEELEPDPLQRRRTRYRLTAEF